MMKLPRISVLGIISFLIVSCGNPFDQGGNDSGVDTGGPTVEEMDRLFIQDATNPSLYSIDTADTAFLAPSGYTLWSLKGEIQTPFTTRTVKLSKSSGDDWAGFGMAVCAYNTGDPLYGLTMLIAMINTHGEFIVGTSNGAAFKALCSWTGSSALNQGLGATNTMTLTRSGSEFVLVLNGAEAFRFTETLEPFHDTGRDGPIIVISPDELLPSVPVRASFEFS